MDREVAIKVLSSAAGLVLYEMATGKCAFAELPTSQLIGAIVRHFPIQDFVARKAEYRKLDTLFEQYAPFEKKFGSFSDILQQERMPALSCP